MRIVIEVKSGCVQAVSADGSADVEVVIVDYDTEGAAPDHSVGGAPANVFEMYADPDEALVLEAWENLS